MSPEEMEAKRKEEEAAMKAATGSGGRGGTRRVVGVLLPRGSYVGGRDSCDGGHSGGRVGPRANVAATEETLSITLTGEQVKQWEQWQKGRAP
jgi:hypothetical protein